MKKKYEPPEIITEDVTIAFAGSCCTDVKPDQFNPDSLPLPWCGGKCTWQLQYGQA